MRGIAAEANDKPMRAMVRKHKADLARQDQLLGPSRLDAEGYKLTAEKMRAVDREHANPERELSYKRRRSPPPGDESARTKAAVNAVVERAIARSEAGRKK